mgnify:CR=1 FL=1
MKYYTEISLASAMQTFGWLGKYVTAINLNWKSRKYFSEIGFRIKPYTAKSTLILIKTSILILVITIDTTIKIINLFIFLKIINPSSFHFQLGLHFFLVKHKKMFWTPQNVLNATCHFSPLKMVFFTIFTFSLKQRLNLTKIPKLTHFSAKIYKFLT